MSEKTIGVGDIIKGFNEKLQKEREEVKRLREGIKAYLNLEIETHELKEMIG
jgi:hypothetical protein